MAVDHVLLVHGYSVRQLSAYGQFPALLSAQGIPNSNIMLSAFLSLDDAVTCDDLAGALEDHVTQFEAGGGTIGRTAVLCHSTGAIVARRWILDRLRAGRPLPSHLVTFAGANHGSTLAQVGRTIIARLFRDVVEQSAVGAQVLADLDYGSSFLWTLNTEWLDAANAGRLDPVWYFSLGGDNHGGFAGEVFWQVGEHGSDSVVRICGANLNYTVVDADPQATPPRLRVVSAAKPTAHLVVPGYTHGGIIGNVRATTDPPFAALLQALAVDDAAGYQAVAADWAARTARWTQENPNEANAMIVFRVRDGGDRPVPDNLVLLGDQQGHASAVSDALEPHQPIQNEAEPSSVAFYVNYGRFMATSPHVVHIEARSGSRFIDYRDVDYPVAGALAALVRPNETTYVDVRVARGVDETYSVVTYDPNRDVTRTWPPLPN
ncbi:MAG TPA: hypothetical protein VEZ44_07830 [bacterium]|nr:hypothetical protein [bacterium]